MEPKAGAIFSDISVNDRKAWNLKPAELSMSTYKSMKHKNTNGKSQNFYKTVDINKRKTCRQETTDKTTE